MIQVNTHEYTFHQFPDGTTRVEVPEAIAKSNSNTAIVFWKYESDVEMVHLMYVVNHLRDRLGFNDLFLTMPYLPNARMDRVKSDTEVFTLKYFCQFINSLNFTTVVILDPHSNVGPALLDRVAEAPIDALIEEAIKRSDADVLFFPDEGAMKRYSGIATRPCFAGVKTRDWATGKITGLDIPEVSLAIGRKVLMIDDICSYGGTFLRAAEEIADHSPSGIYLYVTHCENSILKGDLLTSGLIDKVYTTDSIFTETHEMIEVI